MHRRSNAGGILSTGCYLKTRDDVAPDGIGLAGHSEGGLIVPSPPWNRTT